MKLGVAGLLGDGDSDSIQRIRDLGFRTASWHIPDETILSQVGVLDGVRDRCEQAGLQLCQLLPPQYPSLVHPDLSERLAGEDLLRRMLDAAVRMGIDNVYVRPGSLSSAGPWTPHPDQRLPEVRCRLVEGLRRLAPEAEDRGVRLALEGHTVSPLYSPSVIQEVFEGVGSPALAFNADPVNLIQSLDQAFRPDSGMDELFDRLGPYIVTAHAKDITVGNHLVLHLEECIPGRGYLNQERFLQRFQQCCPDGAVLIEHLPADQVPEARDTLLRAAERAGLAFE